MYLVILVLNNDSNFLTTSFPNLEEFGLSAKKERLEDFSLPEKKLEEISLNWHSKQGKFNNIFAKDR